MSSLHIVTLQDVLTHLRYPSTNDDDNLQLEGFIAAADEVIRAECGDVVPKQYQEYYNGGDVAIYLRHTPVISVNTVIEGWGFTNFELTYTVPNQVPQTSLFAYAIDNANTGKITRRSAANVLIPFVGQPYMQNSEGNIYVDYVAGQLPVPANVRLAALELIAHWWQNSQQRQYSAGGVSSSFDTDVVDSASTEYYAGVPYRILELLRPSRRLPVIG